MCLLGALIHQLAIIPKLANFIGSSTLISFFRIYSHRNNNLSLIENKNSLRCFLADRKLSLMSISYHRFLLHALFTSNIYFLWAGFQRWNELGSGRYIYNITPSAWNLNFQKHFSPLSPQFIAVHTYVCACHYVSRVHSVPYRFERKNAVLNKLAKRGGGNADILIFTPNDDTEKFCRIYPKSIRQVFWFLSRR